MGAETGALAAVLGLTTAMLAAMVTAYKILTDVLKDSLKTCQAEKTTCYSENKITVEKAYALAGAFGELKTVTMGLVEKMDKVDKIERVIEDLQRDLARRGGS